MYFPMRYLFYKGRPICPPPLSSYYKAAKDGCRQIWTLCTFVLYLLGRFWTDFNKKTKFDTETLDGSESVIG